MTKYLLLIALAAIVWWLWLKSRAPRSAPKKRPVAEKAEQMVQCSYCGVNQPVGESTLVAGRYYCCNEHRRAAESEGH